MTEHAISSTSPQSRWVNEDGSTNVYQFIRAYMKDDNCFWVTDTGHVQNVLDELIEQLYQWDIEKVPE